MLATVRTVGECDSFAMSPHEAPANAGGFVSFVSPPFDLGRAHRFHAVLPASMYHFEARRIVLELEDDYRALLADNPALLTGLLPQEAPRRYSALAELGSDNYIG
jgi:hypothetical protein